jgi:hypothetical protein
MYERCDLIYERELLELNCHHIPLKYGKRARRPEVDWLELLKEIAPPVTRVGTVIFTISGFFHADRVIWSIGILPHRMNNRPRYFPHRINDAWTYLTDIVDFGL